MLLLRRARRVFGLAARFSRLKVAALQPAWELRFFQNQSASVAIGSARGRLPLVFVVISRFAPPRLGA
jgi:hypothetical protein